MTIAAVILAAGGSSRMGTPKQALLFRGRPLVAHAVQTAVDASLSPVLVITGAEPQIVERSLQQSSARVLLNHDWQRGIGTSIRLGVSVATSDLKIDALIICLADQPLVDPSILRSLAVLHPAHSVAACRYAGSTGVPALFDRAWFPRLQSLGDDQGAKSLLREAGDALGVIDFPGAEIDIDTPEDYRRIAGAT